MYAKSQQRIKNWPNTLQALRKRKDDSKYEVFQKEEEEKRKIDQQEENLVAEKKRQIIEKANR